MGQTDQKNRQQQKLIQKEESVENKNVGKLVQALEELKRKEKFVDIQVCPKCKSVRLRRVNSMMGDMTGHLGWLPVMYECLDCGWRGRLEEYVTNKKQSWKEIAIIAEASNLEEE